LNFHDNLSKKFSFINKMLIFYENKGAVGDFLPREQILNVGLISFKFLSDNLNDNSIFGLNLLY